MLSSRQRGRYDRGRFAMTTSRMLSLAKSFVFAIVVLCLALVIQWRTHSLANISPGFLRDELWKALQAPYSDPGCPAAVADTIEKHTEQGADNAALLRGAETWTQKSQWCDTRHVQVSVLYFPTDRLARRMAGEWSPEAGWLGLPIPGETSVDSLHFRNMGMSNDGERQWGICLGALRGGNYVVKYRLDVDGAKGGCEGIARLDMELIRKSMDDLVETVSH